MNSDLREQVARQCEAIVHMATVIAKVRQDYVELLRSGAMSDGMLDTVGRHTAHQMEVLGDLLNGMDAVEKEDEQFFPVFEEAQRRWPSVVA